MKIFCVVVLTALLSGCLAAPSYIQGHYYMAGDSQCRRGNIVPGPMLMCRDGKGNFTEYRTPMDAQQVTSYNQQMEQSNQALQQSMHDLNASTQRTLEQMSQYTVPQPIAPSPTSSSQTICLKSGNYVSCNSDSGYDTKCIKTGNIMSCKD